MNLAVISAMHWLLSELIMIVKLHHLAVISVIQDANLHKPGCYQCYAVVVISVNHDSKVTPHGFYKCYTSH